MTKLIMLLGFLVLLPGCQSFTGGGLARVANKVADEALARCGRPYYERYAEYVFALGVLKPHNIEVTFTCPGDEQAHADLFGDEPVAEANPNLRRSG